MHCEVQVTFALERKKGKKTPVQANFRYVISYRVVCCSITEEPLLLSVYLTIVVNKAEIEKQIAVSVNSPEYYYNKWKPFIIEKKFVG